MRFAVRSVIIVLLGSCACISGQDYDEGILFKPAAAKPRSISQDVSILKQIHRHNEDGSYTYGYEGSDGSFKIETKLRSGEVSGKYGYVDDVGKLRVVEYGANKYGFQPSGDGITVPPPTLVELKHDNDDDDDDEPNNFEEPAPRPVKRPQPSSGKPRKPSSFQGRPDGFVQQQQQQQQQQRQPIPNSAVRSTAAEFDGADDGGWNVPTRSARPPLPADSSFGRPTANRPKPMFPPVAGSFAAAPEQQQGPSGSYQTETDFGSNRRPSGNGNKNNAPVVVEDMYQTYEEPQEDVQVIPVKQTKKNGGARARAQTFGPVASNPRRTNGGVLDQLAQQYALPETGSPVSHSVSFGLDH